MRAADARLGDGSELLTAAALLDFRAHAIEAYPEECLGAIDAKGSYVRLENVSPTPRVHACAPKGQVVALSVAGQLRALCHSHPDGIDGPSEPDMRAQIEWAIPFVLCATNGTATTEPFAWGDQVVDDRDLVGRPFRHGVTDCYALCRAYYRETRGVLLPDYPRNWEWWVPAVAGGKDLYSRFFADAGFYEIDPREVVEGDAWLASIRSDVPNHAGVVLDRGLILHHASGGRAYDPSRLSKREPLTRIAPHVTHWLRRD